MAVGRRRRREKERSVEEKELGGERKEMEKEKARLQEEEEEYNGDDGGSGSLPLRCTNGIILQQFLIENHYCIRQIVLFVGFIGFC